MTDLNTNSAKFCKHHEKIAKIHGAKDCKCAFRAVQRKANLVDLENPCKMRLFSLSYSILLQFLEIPLKFRQFFFFFETNGRAWRPGRRMPRRPSCPPAMARKSHDCLAEKETTENASYREKATEKGARPPKGQMNWAV